MRYNKLQYLSFLFFTLALSISFVSCEQVESIADESGLKAKEVMGTWMVSEYNGADISEFWYGPYKLTIYNTSLDQNSIWIDNIYDSGYRVKAELTSESTFAVTDAVDFNGNFIDDRGTEDESDDRPGTIEIKEAQVVNQDSIIFKVILYDADGEVYDDYYEAGVRFTGWED